MRLIAIILGVLLYASMVRATDYYLSNAGNDNHDGTSETSAWASIERLNAVIPSLRPGDRVLFERGGLFSGPVHIQNLWGNEARPITFGAYGSGPDPVIDGTRDLKNWTKEGNIWTSPCPDCPLEIYSLFIDHESQPLGRYPNETSLTSSGGSGRNTVHDTDLSFEENYWKDAQLVISTQTWVCDALRVFSQVGTTVTLAERAEYTIAGEKAYFFQNHYNTLDTEGEWAYDNTGKEIYLYTTRDLASARVSIGSQNECMIIRSSRYIQVEHLLLRGSRISGVFIAYSHHIGFKNNTLEDHARTAIHVDHSDHVRVDGNTVLNTLNIGIGSWDSNHCRFTNNRLENTATIAGRGKNGTAQYSGIIVSRGKDNTVQYNEVIQTGYNAITFYDQTNLLIKNNYVNGYCTVITDGGGIYTWHSTSPGNRIIGNIILNSRDDLGIYIDDESEHIEISGNTTAFNGAGIFIHNSRYIKILNNLCFNNHGSQLLMARHGQTLLDHNEYRNNHVFTTGKRTQYSMRARFVNGENIVFENNCYADPFKKRLINSESSVWKTKVYTVPEWQDLGYITDRGLSRTFTESGGSDTTNYIKFFINPSKSVKTFELPGTYRDLDNQVYVGTVQLEPYAAIVLMAEEKD